MRVTLKIKPAFQHGHGGENFSIAWDHPLKDGITVTVNIDEADIPQFNRMTTTGILLIDEIQREPATPSPPRP